MESFALLLNAKLLNKKATTLLMVSDSFIFADKLSSLEFNNFSSRSQFKNLKLVHNITRGDMHEYRNN